MQWRIAIAAFGEDQIRIAFEQRSDLFRVVGAERHIKNLRADLSAQCTLASLPFMILLATSTALTSCPGVAFVPSLSTFRAFAPVPFVAPAGRLTTH